MNPLCWGGCFCWVVVLGWALSDLWFWEGTPSFLGNPLPANDVRRQRGIGLAERVGLIRKAWILGGGIGGVLRDGLWRLTFWGGTWVFLGIPLPANNVRRQDVGMFWK